LELGEFFGFVHDGVDLLGSDYIFTLDYRLDISYSFAASTTCSYSPITILNPYLIFWFSLTQFEVVVFRQNLYYPPFYVANENFPLFRPLESNLAAVVSILFTSVPSGSRM